MPRELQVPPGSGLGKRLGSPVREPGACRKCVTGARGSPWESHGGCSRAACWRLRSCSKTQAKRLPLESPGTVQDCRAERGSAAQGSRLLHAPAQPLPAATAPRRALIRCQARIAGILPASARVAQQRRALPAPGQVLRAGARRSLRCPPPPAGLECERAAEGWQPRTLTTTQVTAERGGWHPRAHPGPPDLRRVPPPMRAAALPAAPGCSALPLAAPWGPGGCTHCRPLPAGRQAGGKGAPVGDGDCAPPGSPAPPLVTLPQGLQVPPGAPSAPLSPPLLPAPGSFLAHVSPSLALPRAGFVFLAAPPHPLPLVAGPPLHHRSPSGPAPPGSSDVPPGSGDAAALPSPPMGRGLKEGGDCITGPLEGWGAGDAGGAVQPMGSRGRGKA